MTRYNDFNRKVIRDRKRRERVALAVILLGMSLPICVIGGAMVHSATTEVVPEPDHAAAHAALAEFTRSRSLIDLQCGQGSGCVVEEIVLVGVGCGPKNEVMLARHEDEFPVNCEAIDAHWVRALNAEGL